jgi:hypothetical protein
MSSASYAITVCSASFSFTPYYKAQLTPKLFKKISSPLIKSDNFLTSIHLRNPSKS